MTCIYPDTKDAIVEKLDKSSINSSDAQEIAEFLEKLPVCTVEGAKKSKRGKRPLSQYNIFLGVCMKKNKRFDLCTPVWSKIKECIQNNGSLESCKSKQGY